MNVVTRLAVGCLALSVGTSLAAQDAVRPSDVNFDEYGAVADPLIGQSGDATRGAEVVSTRGLGNCVACHRISDLDEVPFHGEVGPSLDGVADRWGPADLRGIVANAKNTFPGTIMPAFYKIDGFIRPGEGFTGKAAQTALDPLLTAQQIEDVVAYLMTLREE